jgi:hypothetical protein
LIHVLEERFVVEIVEHDSSIVFQSVGGRRITIDLDTHRVGGARVLAKEDAAHDAGERERRRDRGVAVEADAHAIADLDRRRRLDRESRKVHVAHAGVPNLPVVHLDADFDGE